MNYIIDLIIVAICIVTVLIFAKKGFVYALVKVVGFVGVFIVATGLGNFLSDYVYNNVIEPNIVSSVMENINNGAKNISDSVYEALPDVIQKNGALLGITEENFAFTTLSGVVSEADVKSVLDKTVEPILLGLLSSIITLIAFAVLTFLVGYLSKFLNKLFSFSVVGTLNKVLGGIIGLPIGVVYALAFCLALNLIISFTKNGVWIFTAETVDSSTLYNLLISIIL